ncbi:hypothetical protein [Actibacterium ureilyticum]|uniref:hypothetical protein n=1 Tax=Actibacterium ureilyticum TaxID=1590614 RepID=UPI000BAB0F9A|nr:hypothetical protein [Actibacterium ureilyticum]
MSDMKKNKPGNTPVQAAWIGIKARRRAQKQATRPQAEMTDHADSPAKRNDGRARLFQLLSSTQPQQAAAPQPPRGRTIKIQKIKTRAARQRELEQRHADAIERLRERKALAAERAAQVADVMDKDDFNFPAPA